MLQHGLGETKDGRLASVSMATRPIAGNADNNGKVTVVADVNQLGLTATALEALTVVLQYSEEAVIGEGLDGTVASWNQGAERLYGYPAAEVIGRPIAILIPSDRSNELAGLMDRIARGEHFERLETTRVRKDGTKIDVSVSLVPIKDAAGKFIGVATIAHDIGDRKRAERFREEYVSLIAHDLRSPLTFMMGSAYLLGRKLSKRELTEEREMAQQILAGGKRLEAMIRDLVASARLEAGQMEMLKERTDLLALIDDLRKRVGSDVEVARIRVKAPERVPPMLADREQVERVIVNLLTNALKYSAPGTPVVVDVGLGDAEAIISVTDQGAGILAEDIPKLFDRFYRAKAGRKADGLGLGLYITRLVVEAHGGRIWVESTVGEGSTFRFTLPLA